MAKNPFLKQRELEQQPKRNTFDLSHTNHLTFQIGKYIPFLCQPVLPGESYELSTAFGLRTPPLVFPIQTKLNARVHYFYVRNKNLWKNWQNFIGKQKNVTMPYIGAGHPETFKVSGLADYLGVPVTYHGKWQSSSEQGLLPMQSNSAPLWSEFDQNVWYLSNHLQDSMLNLVPLTNSSLVSSATMLKRTDVLTRPYIYGVSVTNGSGVTYGMRPFDVNPNDRHIRIAANPDEHVLPANAVFMYLVFTSRNTSDNKILAYRRILANYTGNGSTYQVSVNYQNYSAQGEDNAISEMVFCNVNQDGFETRLRNDEIGCYLVFDSRLPSAEEYVNYTSPVVMSQSVGGTEITSVNDLPVNPYTNSQVAGEKYVNNIRISALPFRAYESIYNGFYRDTRNNPLIVDGEPEYNKFITTDADGADVTEYKLFNSNYEADYLTTATQTPQQGIAPLIGITGTGLMSFQANDGSTIYAQAKLDEDGNTVIGLDGYDEKLPDGSLQILQDTISAGISINDLRNVNALQRWLERNLRLGFRYKELVKAQFGVDINWSELDMPEFIGGTSKTITISQVTQTTPGAGGLTDSLGSIAGQAGLVGETESIRHYCDDYGYIIGIISVVPVPVYSQSIPKHFLASSPLDYFSPDFAFIGAQPILNKEVAPLQAYQAEVNDGIDGGDLKFMDNVFGYQRAWYDLIQNFDTAHGLFRTELRNFIYHRTFDNVPELGVEFLTVDASQFNNVFQVTQDTDKIYGEIYIKCSAKRPIPEVVIPKLEA